MTIGVLVLGKDSGYSQKKGTDWYSLKYVITVAPESPILVGQVLNKFVEKELFDSTEVDPGKTIELDVTLRNAYNPQYADIHLNVDIVEDVQEGGK